MPFLDLHEGILSEFADWAPRARVGAWVDQLTIVPRRTTLRTAELRPRRHRDEAGRRLWVAVQNERYKARRAVVRAVACAHRDPCPQCGGAVERDAKVRPDGGRGPKIPTYCSRKCMRAAIWARWHAKHGAERNARRRAA